MMIEYFVFGAMFLIYENFGMWLFVICYLTFTALQIIVLDDMWNNPKNR